MYPIGRNKTVFTKEIFEEAYKQLWGSSYNKAIQKFLYLLAVIFIGSFVFVYGVGLPPFYLITETFFVCVILFYILVMVPRNYKKKILKKMAMGEKGDPWRNYVFYTDHVLVTFPNETTDECYYRDFTKIHHGDKIILVYTAGKRNLLFDKSGFIGEMPDFLKEENAEGFLDFVAQFAVQTPTPIYREADKEQEIIPEEEADTSSEELPASSSEDTEE